MRPDPSPFGVRAISYKNNSGETVPAYGVIKITGTSQNAAGVYIFTGDKPDTWGSQYRHYVNGPIDIADGDGGVCYVPTSPVWAKYDTGDTPAVGEAWGPTDDSWELSQHVGGFEILSAEPDDGKVLVIQRPLLWFIGKTDASHNQGASGTISIWSGATVSSLSDTTVNKTSVYNRFADMETTKWVKCSWHKNDEWELVAGEC
jgi:hypothetical protein